MAAKDSNRTTGSSSTLVKLVPLIVIVVGVAVALYFMLSGSGTHAPSPATASKTSAAQNPAAAPAAAAPAVPIPDLSPEQLLKEAGTAFREQRFVAPQGNNALEYYLRVLEKEPHNQTSADALREMFPFATGAVEQDINAGSVDEATRVINLLAKADPSNYTLTILRSKLDAKKKQVEKDLALQTAAAAAAAAKAANANNAAANAASAQNAAAAPATQPPPSAPAPAAAAPVTETGTATAKPADASRTAAANTAAPAPANGGETQPAAVLKAVAPVYPSEAARSHQDGWVEVQFTVKADGSVANATVVNANPARIFNSAALKAVTSWTFKPRMENGRAVDETLKRRIEFKL